MNHTDNFTILNKNLDLHPPFKFNYHYTPSRFYRINSDNSVQWRRCFFALYNAYYSVFRFNDN